MIHEFDEDRRYRLRARQVRLQRVLLRQHRFAVVIDPLPGDEVENRIAIQCFAKLGHQHLHLRFGLHADFQRDFVPEQRVGRGQASSSP